MISALVNHFRLFALYEGAVINIFLLVIFKIFLTCSCLFLFQSVVRKLENTKVKGSTPEQECLIADSGIIDVPEPYIVDKKPVPDTV